MIRKITSDFKTLNTVLDLSLVYLGYLVMDSCGVLLYRLYFPGFRDSHFIQSEIIIVFTNPSQAKLLLHFCVKTVLQLSDLPQICVLIS